MQGETQVVAFQTGPLTTILSFFVVTVTTTEVLRVNKNLKNKQSTGFDQISVELIKNIVY